MSGIILFAILYAWFFAVHKISRYISQIIGWNPTGILTRIILPLALFISPMIDEIIGGFQFRALCKAEAIATYDEAKVRGKTVHLISADTFHFTHTILPTYKQTWKFVDHITNEELFSYVDLHSGGGWVSRWINFNNVHRPYTFDGVCSGKSGAIFHKLKIKNVNRD